jgi:hypothetical protein
MTYINRSDVNNLRLPSDKNELSYSMHIATEQTRLMDKLRSSTKGQPATQSPVMGKIHKGESIETIPTPSVGSSVEGVDSHRPYDTIEHIGKGLNESNGSNGSREIALSVNDALRNGSKTSDRLDGSSEEYIDGPDNLNIDSPKKGTTYANEYDTDGNSSDSSSFDVEDIADATAMNDRISNIIARGSVDSIISSSKQTSQFSSHPDYDRTAYHQAVMSGGDTFIDDRDVDLSVYAQEDRIRDPRNDMFGNMLNNDDTQHNEFSSTTESMIAVRILGDDGPIDRSGEVKRIEVRNNIKRNNGYGDIKRIDTVKPISRVTTQTQSPAPSTGTFGGLISNLFSSSTTPTPVQTPTHTPPLETIRKIKPIEKMKSIGTDVNRVLPIASAPVAVIGMRTEQKERERSNSYKLCSNDILDDHYESRGHSDSRSTHLYKLHSKPRSESFDSPHREALFGTSPPGIDMTMVVGGNASNQKTIDKLRKINTEARRVSKWVEDDSVAKCFGCGAAFSFTLRRHHCRLCGRVFCYYCSNYFTRLPLDILNKIPDRPQSFTELIWGEDLNGPVRVCATCYSHASKLIRLRKTIKVFELCQFNIRDLAFLGSLSTDWEDASKFLLSKFREIQYKMSIEELTPSEKRLLWINRNFLTGHSRWMVQLVKATDLSDDKSVLILEQLLYKKKKNRCWDTMCTRFCSEKIGITDVLDLIRYNNNYPVISTFILKCLSPLDQNILINYLPFLVHNITNNEFLLDILLDKGVKDFKFMSHLYWCIKVFCVDNDMRTVYIVKTLTTIKTSVDRDFRHKFKEMIGMERIDIKRLNLLNDKPQIVLPICPDKVFKSVDDKHIKIMTSYSQPTIIYFNDESGMKKPIMFKNDDIRKDYIVLNIINIISDILKEEEPDLNIDIVRYSVMPTSRNTGYIEIVENASTIFNIMYKKGITIQNYILNNNKTQVIATFRYRFIKSTALYCVVSYLLGIGDRHLDNIMISKDGLLFHIDFGFILGQDPKYSNNRLIRVTPEIINVIGGYGTEDYDYFKKLCVRIYNRLRLHVNLFSNLLSVIPSIDPAITIDIIKRELTERFEIGENYLEAATHMDNKVENKNHFEYMIIDFLYKSKHSSIYKGLSFVTGTLLSALKK